MGLKREPPGLRFFSLPASAGLRRASTPRPRNSLPRRSRCTLPQHVVGSSGAGLSLIPFAAAAVFKIRNIDFADSLSVRGEIHGRDDIAPLRGNPRYAGNLTIDTYARVIFHDAISLERRHFAGEPNQVWAGFATRFPILVERQVRARPRSSFCCWGRAFPPNSCHSHLASIQVFVFVPCCSWFGVRNGWIAL